VEVPTDTIVSVRPAPGRGQSPSAAAIGIEQLERIAAAGWQPLEQVNLGDWYLRAANGFTGRANSVLPLGDVGMPLDAALAEIEAFYRQRQLPAKFQVPLPLGEDLDQALANRGWGRENTTWVMTADTMDVLARVADRVVPRDVMFDDEPSHAWLTTYSYRGEPIPAIAKDVMTNASQPIFASIAALEDVGKLVAVARGVITGSWLGITALDVDKHHRRKRLATTIVDAMLKHARERGCRFVYLQVAAENTDARTMYDEFGFARHHSYQYRVKPLASLRTVEG
jgi:ribosomal protein S18 acetylase RimI-like enzyme